MSKLRYFSQRAIDFAKANMDDFYALIKENPDGNHWLKSFFGFDPFVETNYEIGDLPFNSLFQDDNTDLTLAIALYEAFDKAGIGQAIAFNEKTMVGLTLDYGYTYFTKTMASEIQKNISAVKDDLFFGKEGPRRAMARNCVGRLYLRVLMTIEPRKYDRYELTRFAFANNQSFRTAYYTYMDGKTRQIAYFRALKRWHQKRLTKKVPYEVAYGLSAHIAVLDNVELLELADVNELEERLFQWLEEHYPAEE